MKTGLRRFHPSTFLCTDVRVWFCVGLAVFLQLSPPSAVAGNAPSAHRETSSFSFPADTFAYTNQLSSDYELDPSGTTMIERPRNPRPSYALHCFVVARSVRQFFQHARFDPAEPKPTPACARYLVRQVLRRSVRYWDPDSDKIVIPGYANLREFSAENEALLKEEGGGAWQSFLQRGNWRMVFPFSAGHQESTANHLIDALSRNRPPLIHLVCFPKITLNHVLLVYDGRQGVEQWEFDSYDPNQASAPVRLFYSPQERRFRFQATPYFAGGPVKVYTIYEGLLY